MTGIYLFKYDKSRKWSINQNQMHIIYMTDLLIFFVVLLNIDYVAQMLVIPIQNHINVIYKENILINVKHNLLSMLFINILTY